MPVQRKEKKEKRSTKIELKGSSPFLYSIEIPPDNLVL